MGLRCSCSTYAIHHRKARSAAQNRTQGTIHLATIFKGKRRCDLPQKVDVLALLRITTQVLSAAAFIGSVIIDEVKNYGAYKSPLYVEPFSAVLQWSTVTIIGLAITAAVVSKVSERPDQVGEIHDGNFQRDEESLKDGWDCRIGYAS